MFCSLLGRTIIWTALGFLLGSIPFSVWIGYLIARTDIRRFGDGNPGLTNAWRAGGWRTGVPALLLDYLKGAVPVGMAQSLGRLSGWWLVAPALAPVLGHAFSPFLRFQGGKAIAATFGIWSALTLWSGPTTLGLSLTLALAIQSTDVWSVASGLAGLLGYLLLCNPAPPLLTVWAGNAGIVLWKHRRELPTPPRLRPWARRLLRRKK